VKQNKLSLQDIGFHVLSFEFQPKSETQAHKLCASLSRLFTRLLIVLPSVFLTGYSPEIFNIMVDFYRDLTGRS